jgi:rhodanese-related sulfurtransferase
MKHKAIRLCSWLVNLCSVTTIAFTVTTLIAAHVSEKKVTGHATLLKLGEVVSVPDVDWRESQSTLVFALSASCRACADSASFYRALLNQNGNGRWQAVAVLPQTLDVATAYMHSRGYLIEKVRQMDLAAIGLSGTPTLLLVDNQGRLLQQWIGRLSPEEEADVAHHLGITGWRKRAAPDGERTTPEFVAVGNSPLITSDELRAMLHRDRRVNVLDVRERPNFQRGRIAGALNIPLDELSVRVPHEVDPNELTVVYCRFQPACAANGVSSVCSRAVDQLRRSGIENPRVIRDPLRLLAQAGLPITGSQDEF